MLLFRCGRVNPTKATTTPGLGLVASRGSTGHSEGCASVEARQRAPHRIYQLATFSRAEWVLISGISWQGNACDTKKLRYSGGLQGTRCGGVEMKRTRWLHAFSFLCVSLMKSDEGPFLYCSWLFKSFTVINVRFVDTKCILTIKNNCVTEYLGSWHT